MITPWEKIMRAGRRGTGIRLTADEVLQLSSDGAIETKAVNDKCEREEVGRVLCYRCREAAGQCIDQVNPCHVKRTVKEAQEND